MIPEVVDLDDARMLDRGRGARLVEEARHQILSVGHVAEQHLDRRMPTDQDMLADIHCPHAAFSDLADETVLADDIPHHVAMIGVTRDSIYRCDAEPP